MRSRVSIVHGFALAVALTGCGGSGGGSTTNTTPIEVAKPKPTISLTSNKSLVRINKSESATLTWTSTNSTSCTASGAWSGTQAISGNVTAQPTTSGKYTYKLTCTGDGGSAEASVDITAPIPVQATSYLNAKNLNIPSQQVPRVTSQSNSLSDPAYGFADFFQEGELSVVTHSMEHNPLSDSYEVAKTKPGKIKFWKKINGQWVDNTALLLSDTNGCMLARKVVIADFNKDGKPDVFFTCSGYDAAPFYGEKSRILLSQADGRYNNIEIAATSDPNDPQHSGISHGASAADVDGDGNLDIVLTDHFRNNGTTPIYVLMGDGKGGFTADFTRVNYTGIANKPYFTLELIDIDGTGSYSLIAGGAESSGTPTKIFKSNSGFFTGSMNIPSNATFSLPYDFVFDAGNLYVLRVNGTYIGSAVQKVKIQTLESSMIYENQTWIDQTKQLNWIDWIMPYQDKIVSVNADFKLSVNK